MGYNHRFTQQSAKIQKKKKLSKLASVSMCDGKHDPAVLCMHGRSTYEPTCHADFSMSRISRCEIWEMNVQNILNSLYSDQFGPISFRY